MPRNRLLTDAEPSATPAKDVAEPSFPALPDDDLEQQRILAAAAAALFGLPLLRVAHYRILRQLGAGGMGEVFLAHDEVLDRPVALKLLRSELTRKDTSALHEREARALAKLSHPNVVQVYEFGRHGGRGYLVMEYVEGQSLRDWLAEQRPSWARILAVFRAAGDGLSAAHVLGFVHRDIKLDNILVGVDGRPRIVDFGLALPNAEASNQRAGTPRYMAPEQLAGGQVDARSDQFGYCVALSEALWGVPLRDPEVDPPPSAVPRWLWRVIRRGLRADPELRWPDMLGLLRALDPRPRRRVGAIAALGLAGLIGWWAWPNAAPDPCLLDGETTEPWTDGRARQLDEAAAMLGEPASGASVTLGSALDQWSRGWREARLRTCRAGQRGAPIGAREVCLARQARTVAALVDLGIAEPESLVAHARAAALALPDPSRCELDDPDSAAPNPAIAGEVEALREVVDRAVAARLLGQAEASLPGLERALEAAERLEYLPLLSELQAELGSAQWLAGSPERALFWLERAARTAFVAGEDRLAARLWLELGGHAVARHDIERARAWLERAEDAWARVGIDAGVAARLEYLRGSVALEAGELELAKLSLEAALAGPELEARPFVLERLAELAAQGGELDQSLTLRSRAREAAEQVFGPEHPRTAQQRYNLGVALLEHDRPGEAALEFKLAIASWQRAHVRPHEDLVEAFILSSMLARAEDRLDDALTHAKRARSVVVELAERDLDGRVWTNLGMVHYARGELELAAEALEHASISSDTTLGPSDPSSLEAAADLAACLLELGAPAQTRALLERVHGATPTQENRAARITATLGLAELELRSQRPELAYDLLEALEVESPLDRLDLALLLALAELRLARDPDVRELADALVVAGERGPGKIDGFVAKLAITAAERARLGV